MFTRSDTTPELGPNRRTPEEGSLFWSLPIVFAETLRLTKIKEDPRLLRYDETKLQARRSLQLFDPRRETHS